MPVDVNILKTVPFFQLMDDDELMALAPLLNEAAFFEGQVIFSGGDPGGTLQVILVGKVRTQLRSPDGKLITLDDLGPGEVFGELSLLDGRPRTYTAIARTEVRTIEVDQGDLKHLFEKRPSAALDMLGAVGSRIRRTEGLLHSIAAKNPNEEFAETRTLGDRTADSVARFGGSWTFVISFILVMVVWVAINTWAMAHPFDPPPFIGLNLLLSMIAALQAPIIMMSQNRQDKKDRLAAELDYQVNVKAELEILELHQRVEAIHGELGRLSKRVGA